jgi:hypothetical protein
MITSAIGQILGWAFIGAIAVGGILFWLDKFGIF